MYLNPYTRLPLLRDAGFPRWALVNMLAISQAESAGDSLAVSPSSDYGWLQINSEHIGEAGFPARYLNDLFDPRINARCGLYVWRGQGFNAWCTFPGGCGGYGSGAAGKPMVDRLGRWWPSAFAWSRAHYVRWTRWGSPGAFQLVE